MYVYSCWHVIVVGTITDHYCLCMVVLVYLCCMFLDYDTGFRPSVGRIENEILLQPNFHHLFQRRKMFSVRMEFISTV